MAKMSDDLAQSILNGAGITKGEIDQLCHNWLNAKRIQNSKPISQTEEKITEIAKECNFDLTGRLLRFARAIEAAHNIGLPLTNTGEQG